MFSPICFMNFFHEFFSLKKENKLLFGSQFTSWKRNRNKYTLKNSYIWNLRLVKLSNDLVNLLKAITSDVWANGASINWESKFLLSYFFPCYFWVLSGTMHTCIYRKVKSTSPSRLEAHADFFRLSMKGKYDVYLLWPFGKKLTSMH